VVSLIFFRLLLTVEVGVAVLGDAGDAMKDCGAAWAVADRRHATGILARFRGVPGRLLRIGTAVRSMRRPRRSSP
jgi:hypothetical protein